MANELLEIPLRKNGTGNKCNKSVARINYTPGTKHEKLEWGGVVSMKNINNVLANKGREVLILLSNKKGPIGVFYFRLENVELISQRFVCIHKK